MWVRKEEKQSFVAVAMSVILWVVLFAVAITLWVVYAKTGYKGWQYAATFFSVAPGILTGIGAVFVFRFFVRLFFKTLLPWFEYDDSMSLADGYGP